MKGPMAEMRSVLVTGAAGSVGSECVGQLVEQMPDAKVIAVARRGSNALDAVASHRNVEVHYTDLAVRGFEERLPEAVDGLVNAAGVASGKDLVASVSTEEFDDIIEVNLRAAFVLVRRYVPGMVERRFGRIVNVGSIWSLRGSASNSVYNISKHGLTGLTRSVAKDHARSNVTCNDVCPGAIESAMLDRIAARIGSEQGRRPDEVLAEWREAQNSGRFVTPQDIARSVLFLLTDPTGAINGHSLVVDGGNIC